MDDDNSGRVLYPEFVDLIRNELKVTKRELPEAELQAVWKSLDDDGSGFIGAGEFARFMKRGEDWESSGWKRGARKIKAVGAMRGKT